MQNHVLSARVGGSLNRTAVVIETDAPEVGHVADAVQPGVGAGRIRSPHGIRLWLIGRQGLFSETPDAMGCEGARPVVALQLHFGTLLKQ
jgi:hypothetical protein